MNALNPKVSLLIKLAQIFYKVNTDLPVGVLPLDFRALLDDVEVLEWYDRMAELEYVLMRPALLAGFEDGVAHATEIQAHLSGTNLEGKPVSETLTLRPGDREVKSQHAYSTLNIGAPTPEMVADAGPPSNYVDQQIGKILNPLVGYTMSAKHPTEGIICSYAEARLVSLAAERCYEEFPPEENYTDHAVTNTETGEETSLPGLPNLLGKEINGLLFQGASSSTLMPLLIQEAEAIEVEELARKTALPAEVLSNSETNTRQLGETHARSVGLSLDEEEDVVDTEPSALLLDEEEE